MRTMIDKQQNVGIKLAEPQGWKGCLKVPWRDERTEDLIQ